MSDALSTRTEALLAQALNEQLVEQRALREIADSLAGVATAVEAILAKRFSELTEAVSRVEARLDQMEQRLADFAFASGSGGDNWEAGALAALALEEIGAGMGLGSADDDLVSQSPSTFDEQSLGEPERATQRGLPDILRAPPQERPIPDGGRLRSRRKGKKR